MKPQFLVALAICSACSKANAAEIGVPGDHAAIQDAINAAKPGDTVIVEAGTYKDQISIKKGVSIKSAGNDDTGKESMGRSEKTVIDSGGMVPAVTLGEGASIDGFTITGAGKFDKAEFDKHFAERGENLPDERGAVDADGAHAAVWIDGVSAKVVNCIVRDNGHPGIGLTGVGNRSEVRNNRVYRNMGGGIGIANHARPWVDENRCFENLRAGIGCRNASPLIRGNTCERNARAGIGIREGAAPFVIGNSCRFNQRAGIGIRMEGTRPLLSRNTCHENGMAGIGCRDGASPVIVDNDCANNRLAGIGAMNNARPVIVGNKIKDNEAAGIGLAACDSGIAVIRYNEIKAKKLVGIGIQKGWTARVKGNQISREGGMPPLVMVFAGARADFVGNTFTGSGVAAIRSQGQIFVGGNKFHCPAPRKGGPPQNAVWALEGSMASLRPNNEIRGWREPKIGAVRVTNREELEAALKAAKAGTTILIAPGAYAGGISVRDLAGQEGQPIVIAGANPNQPPVFRGGNTGWHLIDPAHIELRDIIIEGSRANGLNIDDGGTAESPAEHVVLSGLQVRRIGPKGNRDGIKLSGVRHFRVEHCEINEWGSGGSAIDMVGCHDGVIADLQFKNGLDTANGVQAKGGSSGIAVRRCRFNEAGGRAVNLGGSTGLDYFRPKDATWEAKDLVVEDCLFSGSMAPVAFVGVDGAIFRGNTIIQPQRWVARILQETTDKRFVPCRNGKFEQNMVMFQSDAIRTAVNVGANTSPETFQFSENVWVCRDRPEASRRVIRLPVKEIGGLHAPELKEWEARKRGEFGAPQVSGVGARTVRE